jgi:hypothetical protein
MSMVLNNLSQINPVLYYIIDNNFAQFPFLYFNLLGTGHLTFMGGGGYVFFPTVRQKNSHETISDYFFVGYKKLVPVTFLQIQTKFLVKNCWVRLFIFCVFQVN